MSAVLAQVLDDARTLERATFFPYIVTAYCEKPDGTCQLYREVIERPAHMAPLGEDIVPAEVVIRWCEVLPAVRFDDMSLSQREKYRAVYEHFLYWRKAKSLGKTPAQLVPWVDYDAIAIDESVERWVKPVGRYAGD